MKKCASGILVLAMLAGAAPAQTAVGPDPGLRPLGRIHPRAAKEIASSPWSIGGETLDRDFADYMKYRSFLGPLGAKAIRLQAGWQKCEKTPGVHDFAWLDAIVDDARAQGVQPWLETSYGNTNYAGGGGTGLGGGLPKSPEALAAWDRWVTALARHFRDRVREWEIWNEPDISKTNAAADFADLFIRTASIVRAEQPDAKIWAMGLAGNVPFLEKFMECVKAKGRVDLIDAVTVHGYPSNPDDTSLIDKSRAVVANYSPSIRIRQGETGAPSTSNTFGALRNRPWTELSQAKWDLRRMLAHHAKDVPFNLFTLMELQYPDRLNTKGLLKSRPDGTVERPKPAYFAAQHVFAVFDDSLERIADLECESSVTNKLAVFGWRKKAGGAPIVAAWFSGHTPSESNDLVPVDLALKGVTFKDPVYADLLTGRVYALPAGSVGPALKGIPVYDSPILIAEKSALPLRPDAAP